MALTDAEPVYRITVSGRFAKFERGTLRTRRFRKPVMEWRVLGVYGLTENNIVSKRRLNAPGFFNVTLRGTDDLLSDPAWMS